MSDSHPLAADFAGRALRLETLVRLRWLAVSCQSATVLFVNFVLGFPLPLLPCAVLIVASALLNVVLRLRLPASHRLTSGASFALLAWDVLQLGGLLYLTGGLDNPFSILLLVPVIVSATTLAPRPTMALGLMVGTVATVLAVAHMELPWRPGEELVIPPLYVLGLWIALVSACAFTGIYAFRVADEARQLANALYATEMVLAREHHLSALDGLAAAAAHELGTPLATIALVARELERELGSGTGHAEDIALLRAQVQRCRDILAKLTSLSVEGDRHLARQPLSHLIDEVAEPYRAFPVAINIVPAHGNGPEPVGRRNPAVVQGLANLLENAADFARESVAIATEWTETHVAITISDDGPGFAPGIVQRLGEPYVTTRAPSEDGRTDHDAGGLGLGLFIAKTLLERTGARLAFANRKPPGSGAVVVVTWPRGMFEPAGTEAWPEPETRASRATWIAGSESL